MDGETTDLVLAAFDLPEKIVKSVMTPIDKIFMLSDQSVINKTLLKDIAAKGRTRIPIYNGNDRNTVISSKLISIISLFKVTKKLSY